MKHRMWSSIDYIHPEAFGGMEEASAFQFKQLNIIAYGILQPKSHAMEIKCTSKQP